MGASLSGGCQICYSVRLNATFVEVEIGERLKSTLPPLEWK